MTEDGEEAAPDPFKLVISIMVAAAAISIALVALRSGILSNKDEPSNRSGAPMAST
jgi:hypothetical protein